MSVFKKEITKYQNILDKLINDIGINSSDEKKMLIDLVNDKILSLNQADEYVTYWHKICSEEEPIERC